tara:strand:+ start:289 stop:510 length:222 start_codon:yes stop_codon:yes gene_type:complete
MYIKQNTGKFDGLIHNPVTGAVSFPNGTLVEPEAATDNLIQTSDDFMTEERIERSSSSEESDTEKVSKSKSLA